VGLLITSDGARPDQRIAEDGSLEEFFIVFENFFGGLADKDFVVWTQARVGLPGHKHVFPQQRHSALSNLSSFRSANGEKAN
jgi:hypothetical protein